MINIEKLLTDRKDYIICINNLRNEYRMVADQHIAGYIGIDAVYTIQNKLDAMINSYERKIVNIDKKIEKYGIVV